MESVSLNVVDPVLSLLRSLHIEVQYEGCLLIKQLVQYNSICRDLLAGLVALLRPSDMELNEISEILEGWYLIIFQNFSVKKHSTLVIHLLITNIYTG